MEKLESNKGKNLFGRLVEGEKFEEISDEFFEFEKEVLSNAFILQFATQEEMATYQMLEELPDKDVIQALRNMSRILEVDEEEEKVIMKMNRYFLKLLMIERWTERADESLKKDI